MSETYLENADQLKGIFAFEKVPSKYIEYTPLIDRKAGFSVKREYPPTIRYRPPKTEDGKADTVALIYVVYDHPAESRKKRADNKIPIFLNITPHSRYLSNHFDYDFNDDNCPMEDSVQESKSTPKPIALESFDEYVYDHSTNTLRDSKNNILSGVQILDKLFKEHCDTVHLFKGLALRWKMGSRDNVVKLCDLLVQIIKWILKIFFGRTFEPKDAFSGSLKIYLKEDMKLLKTESIDVYGYKASKNVIITFASLILLGYIIAYKFSIKSELVHNMMTNNLLLICFTLVALGLLDHVIPFIFLKIINGLIRLKVKLAFMKLKA
jgi:hypothetical protein